MDKDLIEKYKNEMLKMYKASHKAVMVNATETEAPKAETPPLPPKNDSQSATTGSLLGIITAVRSLYPVKNAKVTIFKGDYPQMEVIDTDLTNESGRTKIFTLPTPEKALSLEEENQTLPYATYNMLVEADGYIKNIHLNIPVFSTVTSLQQSNLILEETAGQDKKPQIFDESQNYDL